MKAYFVQEAPTESEHCLSPQPVPRLHTAEQEAK